MPLTVLSAYREVFLEDLVGAIEAENRSGNVIIRVAFDILPQTHLRERLMG